MYSMLIKDNLDPLVCFFVLAAFGLCFLGCKTLPFQPTQYEGELITIGTGGGFAGIETSFHILSHGVVYKQIGQDTTLVEHGKIPRKNIHQTIENCKTFALYDYEYQEPGNAYKFMVLKMNGKSNRIVWSGDDHKIKPLCKNIYQSLNNLIHEE